jgi:hypothetical protein
MDKAVLLPQPSSFWEYTHMMLLLADHGDDALCYHVNACTWESKKYGYSAGVCPAVMVVGAGDNTEFVFLMVGVTVVVVYMRRVVRREEHACLPM